MGAAENNPKHAAGSFKPNYRHVPMSGLYEVGKVMDHGAAKYGAFNWVKAGVCLQVYIDAMRRHLDDLAAGIDHDGDSGLHHCAHIAADALILLDCVRLGNLEDDRPGKGAAAVPVAEAPLAVDQSLPTRFVVT